MKITKNKKPIMAADFDIPSETETEFVDTIDDIADSVDDIQDTMEQVEEEDVDIEMDNNIANHYIAECDSCHGIFVSALIQSDQEVESITGICPLCDKDTTQYLYWIIKNVRDVD
jgi:hypothetical protein